LGKSGYELSCQFLRSNILRPNKDPMKLENRTTSEPVRRELIDENRASYLLGVPKDQLREICEMSGLGHLEEIGSVIRLVFTYEELYKLCRLIVGPSS
jgi:hypothetical protein